MKKLSFTLVEDHGFRDSLRCHPEKSYIISMPDATATDPSILPALAFSLDMFSKTAMQYGVNEVLLATVLGAVVFAVFAAQPLVIVGVTGQSIVLHGDCH